MFFSLKSTTSGLIGRHTHCWRSGRACMGSGWFDLVSFGPQTPVSICPIWI